MRVMKRVMAAAVAFALLFTFIPGESSAATPYQGYIWSTKGRDVASINGYMYKQSIDGFGMPSGAFNAPEDVFIADDKSVYVVDTGNSRIVQLDSSLQYVRTIGDSEGDGVLSEPKGVYVTPDGTIYVADTKNGRIVLFDKNGKYLKQFGKPDSPLIGDTFSYSPSKLLVDKRGYMFVVSDGNTQGLLQIDKKGAFKGFYGANHIGFSWGRLLRNMFATDAQKSQMATIKPLEFSNAVLDNEGFIFTTTLGTETTQIKRLSPVGVDTIGGNRQFGDRWSNGPFMVSSFIDVAVDSNGIFTGLDLQTGKVFQYDKLGNMLFAFGGIGEQNGLFVTPSALAESSDGTIFVADKGRNRIDLFRTTPFALLVQKAAALYVDGRYDEAESLWNEVLRENANYELAYLAIGKSLYKAERYKEAMSYFKLANSRGDYSVAFKEYRKEYMRDHFFSICLILVGAIILLRYLIPWVWRLVARRIRTKRPNHGAQQGGGIPQ
ncbi:hypothetical protein H8B09_28175 [Paenibacillus sp. PR3]|uniref:SMP-30/Gluconolactonase/LRE-like region domain-containing protein n=1 Tax=Paenibacillus terricola TaxID=2763503 RepID=A0ABR8N386_9BACL|nr:hypothetical protein [Paenibacillus terricola]MBD3922637.1 hypothetical protein [Paenibacillus terricola]